MLKKIWKVLCSNGSVFTGFALKIYLNERPFEPRERDYALVGSFYVFAIWIGFGFTHSMKFYKIFSSQNRRTCNYLRQFIGQVLMASKLGWSRSFWKYTLAMAKAYLTSCDPNAILFTMVTMTPSRSGMRKKSKNQDRR
jgi:hypothetical protein